VERNAIIYINPLNIHFFLPTIDFTTIENWYSGVFEITDYESEVKIQEFKIADLIWQTQILKNDANLMKMCFWEFSESVITNP